MIAGKASAQAKWQDNSKVEQGQNNPAHNIAHELPETFPGRPNIFEESNN